MLEQLNAYTGALLLFCGALLILGCALLCMLLVRQRRQQERMRDQTERNVDRITDCIAQGRQQLSDQTANAFATLEDRLRGEMARQQAASAAAMAENGRDRDQRLDQLGARLDAFGQAQDTRLHRMSVTLDEKLSANDQRTEKLRESLAQSMEKMQKDNAEKLESMRQTVDEKLHETLNKRLGESFSLVNERLEQVYKGLGEMQSLATGVGDLKRVLSNVKTRGIWGEVQLGTLLSQMLAPGQYAENVAVVPGSAERVEFAVILPGKDDTHKIYLPIDSKFPMEDYDRLLTAVDGGDPTQVNAASNELCSAIRTEAKRIAKKYIVPPYTTDFAVMFLATEGLYAEALRSRGLMEELQQNQRVLIAGPSTLSALLSSLQLGFRTLAIEQRSAEVWQLLGAVKSEFGRFSDLLDQTQQRLRQAGETIEKASVRTRAINRRLRDVEALSDAQSVKLLPLDDAQDEESAS